MLPALTSWSGRQEKRQVRFGGLKKMQFESELNLSQSNIRTSIGHIKETSRSVPDRSDELDILSKYLPAYTESLTEKEIRSKKTKKASLVDRYLNPSLSQEIGVEESPDPEMPKHKKIREDITRSTLELNGDFGKGSIDLMIKKASSKPQKRQQSHSWTEKDYTKSLLSKTLGTAKSLLFTRNKLVPLPAESTTRRNFRFMFVEPARLIKPVMIYLSHLMPTLTPVHRLAKMAFDKTKLKEIANTTKNNDTSRYTPKSFSLVVDGLSDCNK